MSQIVTGHHADEARITAVLGPTNTGKTHFAIERLTAHHSGMIGFPLRLLARENYDRVCELKGRHVTALITGEERIVPPGARYFLCTTESMPVHKALAFVAIDEVQLCADPDRGHVFTDRLLHCRGLAETMFLGADTMTGIIRSLVPEAEIIKRPRFSTLTHSGFQKVTRLPRRSAAVAFSASDVYALAELVRRHRGGTAVVLGALSPRTRNAQVDMYQSGEVDYLVATDAIGMGLNMDVTHVAFAGLTKFDGHSRRRLANHEIAQIAGRAGRHITDGTFGTTANAKPFADEQVEAIEEHRFDPVKKISWRNNKLDFQSVDSLIRSLEQRTEQPELIRIRDSEDHMALRALAQDESIRSLAQGRHQIARLWEVCQVPDFRQIMSDAHINLLAQLYRYLAQGSARLPHDWVADHLARLERTDGDIDALMARISHVRTWTYIAHREDWLDDPIHWQERSRALEDKLSDALHEQLTQRFVDKRSASLLRHLQSGVPLTGAVRQNGEVLVEGEFVGELKGFRFVEDSEAAGSDAPAIQTAARKALVDEIQRRVQACVNDQDAMFDLAADGYIAWRKAPVAQLQAGEHPLKPKVDVLPTELLDGGQRDQVLQRVEKFIRSHTEELLGPLLACENLEASGSARGIAFQVFEGLGSQPRYKVEDLIKGLEQDDRRALHKVGVRLGPLHVFQPKMGKTHQVNLRAMLWSLHQGRHLPAPVPANGRTSVKPTEGVPHIFYNMIGYPVVGPLAIRMEILDRVISKLHDSADGNIATMDNSWAELLGCSLDDLKAVLTALGYQELPPEDVAAPENDKASSAAQENDKAPSAAPESETTQESDATTVADAPAASSEPAPETVTEPPPEPSSEATAVPADATASTDAHGGTDQAGTSDNGAADNSTGEANTADATNGDTEEAAGQTAGDATGETTEKAPPVRFKLTKPRLGGPTRREPKRGDTKRGGQKQGSQGKNQPPDGPKHHAKQDGTRPERKGKGKRQKPKGGREKAAQFKGDNQPMTYSPFEKLRALQQAQNSGQQDSDKAE
ncbi:MAG: helicase-related protein [Pseudomonadota bacterium]